MTSVLLKGCSLWSYVGMGSMLVTCFQTNLEKVYAEKVLPGKSDTRFLRSVVVSMCQSSSAVSEHLVPVCGAVWEDCGIFRRQKPTGENETLRGLEVLKASQLPVHCVL